MLNWLWNTLWADTDCNVTFNLGHFLNRVKRRVRHLFSCYGPITCSLVGFKCPGWTVKLSDCGPPMNNHLRWHWNLSIRQGLIRGVLWSSWSVWSAEIMALVCWLSWLCVDCHDFVLLFVLNSTMKLLNFFFLISCDILEASSWKRVVDSTLDTCIYVVIISQILSTHVFEKSTEFLSKIEILY